MSTSSLFSRSSRSRLDIVTLGLTLSGVRVESAQAVKTKSRKRARS